jgi:TPR repeat protein
VALLEKAAGQGHAYAMFELAGIHHARKEYEHALEWSTKAAEAGQGLTLAHFRAQVEDLREHIAPVTAQLEHLRATSPG